MLRGGRQTDRGMGRRVAHPHHAVVSVAGVRGRDCRAGRRAGGSSRFDLSARADARQVPHVRRALHRRPYGRHHTAEPAPSRSGPMASTSRSSTCGTSTRCSAPTGVTQKWMQLWEGDYTRALPQRPARASPSRASAGRSPRHSPTGRSLSERRHRGQFYTGSGVDPRPSGQQDSCPRAPRTGTHPVEPRGQHLPERAARDVGGHFDAELRLTGRRRASNHQAVWVYPKSPTTPYRSPDSQAQQSRYLLLDPRATDSDGRSGRDEWWFVIERNWPSEFDPYRHGDWGRLVNFHNVAGDVGWDRQRRLRTRAHLAQGARSGVRARIRARANAGTPRTITHVEPSRHKAAAVVAVGAIVGALALAGGWLWLRRTKRRT